MVCAINCFNSHISYKYSKTDLAVFGNQLEETSHAYIHVSQPLWWFLTVLSLENVMSEHKLFSAFLFWWSFKQVIVYIVHVEGRAHVHTVYRNSGKFRFKSVSKKNF